MRVFVDTNIIVSSVLFPHGKVASVFSYIVKTHDVIIASYAIKECELVFDRKFPDKKGCLRKFLDTLTFDFFETPHKINPKKYPQIRDSKDLPILVSAILSDADILLTGDKDFEDIQINKPLIFTPNQYFDLLKKKDD